MHLHPEHAENHFTASDTVRDVVVGMSDGLTVPFALAARLLMTLSLTFDHRVVDGAPAAAFLTQVADLLEEPGRVLGAVVER